MISDPLPPSAPVLRWAEDCIGVGARVRSVRRLVGGTANHTHELTVELASSSDTFILRRPFRDLRSERLGREAETLAHLAAHAPGTSAPRVVAYTPGVDGSQALLMTRLAGQVDLAPADRGA